MLWTTREEVRKKQGLSQTAKVPPPGKPPPHTALDIAAWPPRANAALITEIPTPAALIMWAANIGPCNGAGTKHTRGSSARHGQSAVNPAQPTDPAQHSENVPADHMRSCCWLAAGTQAHWHTVCLTRSKVADTAGQQSQGQAACSSTCTKAWQCNSTYQVVPATQFQSRRGHKSRIQQDKAPTNAAPVTCHLLQTQQAASTHLANLLRLWTHTDNDYQLPQDRLQQQRPARAHLGALHKCPAGNRREKNVLISAQR